MTADIRLTARELDALEDLVRTGHIYAYFLYISAFRRRMDFTTRCVGLTEESTVSRNWCLWLLERDGERGSHFGDKRRDLNFVKRQVWRLRKVGLLADLPREFLALRSNKKMQFFLPFAFAGLNRPQEERPQERPQSDGVERPPGATPKNTVVPKSESLAVTGVEDDFRGCSAVDKTEGATLMSDPFDADMNDPMNDPIQVLYRNPINQINILGAVDNFDENKSVEKYETPDFVFEKKVGDGYAIPANWEPSDAAIEYVLQRTTWTRDKLAIELPMFIFYWRERNESKPKWDMVYQWFFTKMRFP